MPFIHIKSLPFDNPFQAKDVLASITADFAASTGIDLKHVTVTWEFFQPGHYAVAGKVAESQPQNSHPVLVDFLAPDFNNIEMIAKMLSCIAESISKRTEIPVQNIFINHRQAHSSYVFDAGEIVRW